MSHNKFEVYQKLRDTGVVPVFYDQEAVYAKEVMKMCYDAGVRAFEFTNRGSKALEIFKILIEYRNESLPELSIGIGSILDAPTAAIFIAADADFVVSPVLNEEVGRLCNRKNLLWMPGCGTLTEMSNANEIGADIVKLFPGQLYGADFVKAVKGPCPWIEIMPTGGISLDTEQMSDWFKAGILCFGIGSNLFKIEGKQVSIEEAGQNLRKAIDFVKNFN